MQFDSDDLAQITYAAPVLLKMLEKRERNLLNRMHGAYCSGDIIQSQNLAEFRVLRDMRDEINAVLRTADKKGKP